MTLPFYKSTRWKHKRENILRRDEYMCRECKRYGRTAPAKTVHHINPLETHSDLAFASWNLVSLCNSCHDEMHDRINGNLTEKGKMLRARASPP